MKIFYCNECKEFVGFAYTKAEKEVGCRFNGDKLDNYVEDCNCGNQEEGYDPREGQQFECPNCCEWEVEIREVKECPHDWREDYSDKAKRICEICGEKQVGKIVF